MEKFLVFTCDTWHTRASKEIIGVCSSMNNAIKVIKQQAAKEGESLSQDDIYNLEHIKQTQSHEGEGEFIIEIYDENTLI